MPDVLYWHCETPLPQMIETLRGVIRREAIEFLIVDSIGYAVNGAAETSSTANEYTQAVRSLGIGSLHLVPCTDDL